jgi:glycosyltransferase involved in cell wall biosynthesis
MEKSAEFESFTNQVSDGISIIICCYNSAQRLPETIRHIGLLEVDDTINWEVIIIDNASTDDTAEVARIEWLKTNSKAPFRIIKQPIPGRINAVILGMKEANYTYYLTVDDDNWLEKSFLNLVYNIMAKNSSIGVLGSMGNACFEDGVGPKWFTGFKRYYAVGSQNDKSGDVTLKDGWVYGACSTIRRSAWTKLLNNNFVFLTTGRNGAQLVSGDDIELCNAIRLAGFKIWYDDSLRFTHFINEKRCNWQYLKRLAVGMGASKLQNEVYNNVFSLNLTDISQVKSFLWLRTALHVFMGLLKKFPSYIMALMGSEGNYNEIEFLFEWARFKQYFVLRSNYTSYHNQVIDLNQKLGAI